MNLTISTIEKAVVPEDIPLSTEVKEFLSKMQNSSSNFEKHAKYETQKASYFLNKDQQFYSTSEAASFFK